MGSPPRTRVGPTARAAIKGCTEIWATWPWAMAQAAAAAAAAMLRPSPRPWPRHTRGVEQVARPRTTGGRKMEVGVHAR
eukprot:4789139-Alexandrium_andersonii.AAC.1